MNPILQLAKKIMNTTNRLCDVGPGPYGFGVHTDETSEIKLVLSFTPNPVVNCAIFPDKTDSYEIKVAGICREKPGLVSPEKVAAYAASDQYNAATRLVAEAVMTLGMEMLHVTTEECHEAFSLMADYELDNEKDYLNTGPYTPADGAALRYSQYSLFHDGEKVGGGGHQKGHMNREDILSTPFITERFSRQLSLREISVMVSNVTYGHGDIVRDVNDDELKLAIRGAFDEQAQVTLQQYMIARDNLNLPPVSLLTGRGMSVFFTAAAERAEQMGFDVNGIADEQLQISNDGTPVIMLYEDGSGSHIYLRKKDPFFVQFPTGPYVPSAQSVGEDGTLNNRIRDLLATVQELRGEIQEVLHPADYPYAVQMERAIEEQGPRLSM